MPLLGCLEGWILKTMRTQVAIMAAIGALALAGTATHASAQSARSPQVSLAQAVNQPVSTSTERAATVQPQQRRGLRWNENGRWGLNFNLNQPVGREYDLGDVEAGAYYRLSPRLRVGAATQLSTPERDPARAQETVRGSQPRVRLETIFKF